MKAVTVSHRIQDQIPEFIKEDNKQFVAFLEQYYKSQEKSGKPYDILGNILRYADIGSGEFDPNFLSSKSAVLEAHKYGEIGGYGGTMSHYISVSDSDYDVLRLSLIHI